jgi:hypothetical protein
VYIMVDVDIKNIAENPNFVLELLLDNGLALT